MKIYLDNDLIKEIDNMDKFEFALEEIENKLKNEIINKVYFNKTEVNFEFLLENKTQLSDDSVLEFETKQISDLINETLKEADDYLPKLKTGVENAADLFREDEMERAVSVYNSCLEGIEWYTEVLQKILSILKEKEMETKGENLLNDLNEILVEMMKAFKKEDMIFVADLLEYEITDYIDEFMNLNKELEELMT